MNVATHVGDVLVRLGVDHVFGVAGSGNFHVTNAMIAAGARYVPAAHETGAATMADAYARASGRVTVLSVHQGPGLTNALTGIAEAAKSRTPLIVLAPEATNPQSNFYIDLQGTALAVGAEFHRVRAASATEDVLIAWRLATFGLGGTVVLGLPLDEQGAEATVTPIEEVEVSIAADPPDEELRALVEVLRTAQRPVFIAGRGAARVPYAATATTLRRLAGRCGALLATSAAAKGLFEDDPWNLDVSGGFATPLAAEAIAHADAIIAWGCTLNMWTTRHGSLIPPDAAVVRIDHDFAALDQPLIAPAARDIRIRGDVLRVADLALAWLGDHSAPGWRTGPLPEDRRWRDVPYRDESTGSRIDPRTLSIDLDDLLPAERVVAVDSGNFMGYPSMFLSVPDARGFCFTQAYQSIGLGLAAAIGAALAQPDRLTVAALGDGGFLMSVAEMTTVDRLRLPMVIVVYNDAAYGAEVHHFGPDGHPLDIVRFPEPHIAAIAEGFGAHGVTVRSRDDLRDVRRWLEGARDRPLVIDAKITSEHGSWWLEEAFRGH
ncbi:MAG TPA: thiamine pyrophosphate-binding protein [Micromonosporaceae bacterium]